MPTPDDDGARATLVANELAKLSASYLNGLAIVVAVVGGLSPILAGGLSDPRRARPFPIRGQGGRLPRGERPSTSCRMQAAEEFPVMVSQVVLMLVYPIGMLAFGLAVYWIAKRDLDRAHAREP